MKNVVVWGCPRSGTSVTFGIFRTHPDYRFFFEPGTWLIKDMRRTHPLALKNPWSHHPTPGLSGDLDEVMELDAVHIWVVRHPHDTVGSLQPGMSEQPHPPALAPRWNDKPLLDRCAALWRVWNEEGYENLTARTTPLIVHYEDLVTNPVDTIYACLTVAGAPWSAETEYFTRRITNNPGENEVDFQDRWHRDHASHIGGHGLSELDKVTIDNIVGAIPQRFGY